MLKINDKWCIHLPALHRALHDPHCLGDLPVFDKSFDLHQACAYWECVYYCLSALLGWADQAKGLAKWYRAGKPVEDSAVLTFLRSFWDREQMLDSYAAWVWSRGVYLPDPAAASAEEIAEKAHYGDAEWWQSFVSRGAVMSHDPFYGGTNPLHLGHSEHFGFSASSSSEAACTYFHKNKSMEIVLVVSSILSWRAELQRCAMDLPAVPGKSWRVKVFDRTTGFLGEFRRSRRTGQWFIGKHSTHMMGN